MMLADDQYEHTKHTFGVKGGGSLLGARGGPRSLTFSVIAQYGFLHGGSGGQDVVNGGTHCGRASKKPMAWLMTSMHILVIKPYCAITEGVGECGLSCAQSGDPLPFTLKVICPEGCKYEDCWRRPPSTCERPPCKLEACGPTRCRNFQCGCLLPVQQPLTPAPKSPEPPCSVLTACAPTSYCKFMTEPSRLARYGYNASAQADLLSECLATFALPLSWMFPGDFFKPEKCGSAPPMPFPSTCSTETPRAVPEPSCVGNLGCVRSLSCDVFGFEVANGVAERDAPDPMYHIYGPGSRVPINLTMSMSDEEVIVNFGPLLRATEKLIVLMHGFTQSPQSRVIASLRLGLRTRFPHATIIDVNWSTSSKQWLHHYPTAAANSLVVGRKTAAVLAGLQRFAPNLSPKRFNLYGFSLGAHGVFETADFYSNITGEQVHRVVALDPAGPCFCGAGDSPPKTKADIVEVIHSDIPGNNKPFSLGCDGVASDYAFSINGGVNQPGCFRLGPLYNFFCFHSRAPEVLADLLSNPPCNLKGLPPHTLDLKIGVPVILLRNIHPPRLCNGTRLAVEGLRNDLIEATILTANYRGEKVLLPRIPLIPADPPVNLPVEKRVRKNGFSFRLKPIPTCRGR